jgi:hypothetical protein
LFGKPVNQIQSSLSYRTSHRELRASRKQAASGAQESPFEGTLEGWRVRRPVIARPRMYADEEP